NGNELRHVLAEFREQLVEQRQLVAAHGTPVGGVKGENDRPTPRVTQPHLLIRSAVKFEVRRCFARSEWYVTILRGALGLCERRGVRHKPNSFTRLGETLAARQQSEIAVAARGLQSARKRQIGQ